MHSSPLAFVTLGSAEALNAWLNHLQISILVSWTLIRLDGMYIPRGPPLPQLRHVRSLQLSTFMPPFNQYGFRPYRVPDHLDHSRHPVMMPPQQPNRALPMRATSFEGWQNPPTVRAPCQPSYATTVNAHVTCTQYNSSVASNPMFTPKSTDLGTSYLAANQAPEIPEPFDSGEDSRLAETASD